MGNTCANLSNSNIYMKAKVETEFGKTETTGFANFFVKSNTVKFSQNAIASELLSAGRSPSKASKGNIEVAGSVEVAVDNVQFGYWAKMLLGGYSVVAAGAKYLHTFKITDGCTESFQFEKTYTGSGVNYKTVGLKANKLAIDFGGEGEIIGTIDILGKNEYYDTVRVNYISKALTADVIDTDTTITLADVTNLEVDEIITLRAKKGEVASLSESGKYSVNVGAGEGSNFTTGDYLQINGITYMLKTVIGDTLYLNRQLEADAEVADVVYNVSFNNKITNIVGNVITLNKAAGISLASATDSIISSSKNVVTINDKTFEHFEIEITSSNGGEAVVGSVETLNFSFSNGQEGKRLIKDKGAFGKILDGKVELTCELNVIFDIENARVIEEAKLQKEFDITLKAVNTSGDYLEIVMPQGTLTPVSPEVSGPGAISVTLTYSPFKKGTSEALVINMLNSVATYA